MRTFTLRTAIAGAVISCMLTSQAQVERASGADALAVVSQPSGLEWLAAQQRPDGSWLHDGKTDDGTTDDGAAPNSDAPAAPAEDAIYVTSLALLAFLGDTNTLRVGPHRDTVKHAVRWLLKQQEQSSGKIGAAAGREGLRDHAIATWALCEAAGMSALYIPKRASQRALNFLESRRRPGEVWRHQAPRGDEDAAADLFVTTWSVLAFCSGAAFDLQVGDSPLDAVTASFDAITDPANGRHGYARPGLATQRLTASMTGAGLTVRMLLGQRPEAAPVLDQAAELLARTKPSWSASGDGVDLFRWFWTTMALYRRGGEAWTAWERPLKAALLDGQRQTGVDKGSWDPRGDRRAVGGRVGSTALAEITLQVQRGSCRWIR